MVISQKWKFEDDILSGEARALLRGLQVMVCAEHVRNARVLCLTACLVHLHLNADALGTLNCWYKYASSHLSVFVIKLNPRQVDRK